jgi:hypothetical protein
VEASLLLYYTTVYGVYFFSSVPKKSNSSRIPSQLPMLRIHANPPSVSRLCARGLAACCEPPPGPGWGSTACLFLLGGDRGGVNRERGRRGVAVWVGLGRCRVCAARVGPRAGRGE